MFEHESQVSNSHFATNHIHKSSKSHQRRMHGAIMDKTKLTTNFLWLIWLKHRDSVLCCGDTGQIEPQMFHPQLLQQNNRYWILNNQPRGKLMANHSKTAQITCQAEMTVAEQRGKTVSRGLKGWNRLCCLLRLQSCICPRLDSTSLSPFLPVYTLDSCAERATAAV